jgi:Glycosyltransferase like family
MSTDRQITFVAAANKRDILETNLLASACLRVPHRHQILVQEGFSSASKAYNDAIDKSTNDLIVFVHQDVILPESWLADLERSLNYLEHDDPQWGVIGCYGETLHDHGRGYVYSSGLGILGKRFDRPARIQTLDEIVLIIKKSSGLRFDDNLPHFHMYGPDICMRAEERGWKNYAISAFCVHNTQPGLILPEEFYECYRHVKRNWKHRLPIQTTCIRMTRFDTGMYRKRLGEMYIRYIRWKEFGGSRATDVQKLLKEVDMMLQQKSTAGEVR